MKSPISRFVCIITVLSLTFLMVSTSASLSLNPVVQDTNPEPLQLDAEIQPTPLQDPIPEPNFQTEDGDFIISYDDDGLNDATYPSIAVTPTTPVTIGNGFAGSIHTVWTEYNNNPTEANFYEVHYSMSWPDEKGIDWSNDEEAENDTIISDSNEATAEQADGSMPSLAIDSEGIIHVIWAQGYQDGTYEIHYSQSMDNGQTWSGYTGNSESLVSYRDPEMNSFWIDDPRIAITDNPHVIHVIWSEWGAVDGISRTMYSRSFDMGQTWSAAMDGDLVISDPGAQDNAFLADIATGGWNNQVVHVTWVQDVELSPGIWGSVIFYVRSLDYGNSWDPIRFINSPLPDTYCGRARAAALEDNVHVVWNQFDISGNPAEIYYSGSPDGGDFWTGIGEPHQISFSDGNDAWGNPVVAADPSNGGLGVHVVWTEVDETSPQGTEEIHESVCPDAFEPTPDWSGFYDDHVISFPDVEDFANAQYPAIGFGLIGNQYKRQVVWSEVNTINLGGTSTGGVATNKIASSNNEIHYIPETTFDSASLSTGWHFLSVPLVQNDETLTTVLDDSYGDDLTTWSMVRWYDASDAGDHWKLYNSASPSTADLTTIDHKMGFWVKITGLGDGKLTFAGDLPSSTTITLKAGWNLVGYPAQDDTYYTVASLKANVTQVQAVEGYSGVATYNIQALSDSYTLTKGEAYWIKVSADTSWTINW